MLNLVEHYRFTETFDTNLTADYEVENWDHWHIVREFISNALDSVSGDISRLHIFEKDGSIHISDTGPGYALAYAKRIGASSKKADTGSIGQFGEGTKLALLTCLRKGISVSIASRDWLIAPRLAQDEEKITVLLFDIYERETPITGSVVSIQATPEILEIIDRKGDYFLQFDIQSPFFGSLHNGIYPKRNGQAGLYNKGVFVKDIDTMFSYALSLSELNRDRDLVDDQLLRHNLRNIWSCVDNPELIQAYLLKAAELGDSATDLKEFTFTIFPADRIEKLWIHCFYELFGEKAVLTTNGIASIEASMLGFKPVKLEHYAVTSLQGMNGIQKDTDVIRPDYAFVLVDNPAFQERNRLQFFEQVATMLHLEMPNDIKLFSKYAKSDYLLGYFDQEQDSIYLKQDLLKSELSEALDTFLHELNHRETGAEDYSRSFADGLSNLLARTVIELAAKVGMPVKLKLTKRGFQLPGNFQFSADNLEGSILAIGNSIHLEAGGYTLKAEVPGVNMKPYSANRSITFYKGRFYMNVPVSIRSQLPEEVEFRMLLVTTDM